MKRKKFKKPRKPFSKKLRMNTVYAMIFASFTALIVRSAYIQVVHGAVYRSEEANSQLVKIAVTPQRGWIYDANGQVLAWDMPSDRIVLNKLTTMKDSEYQRIANELAPVLHKSAQALYNKMKTDTNDLQVPLTTDATKSQIAFVIEHQGELPNVEINQSYQRQYPKGDLAGQVLGYVGSMTQNNVDAYKAKGYTVSQKVGVSGLEAEYESLLQGKAGNEAVTIDPADGTVHTVGSMPPPIAGDNIQLTLDGHLQAESQMIIQNLINSSANKSNIAEASAVMLNVKTGGVLAMVSYPYLNPNWFTNGKGLTKSQVNYLNNSGAQENYVIQSAAYPGSTVKPANLITALKAGVLTPNSSIDDNGYIYIGKTRLNEDMGMQFGWLNPIRAVAVSSDVFFYQVGLRLGQWNGSSATSGGSYPAKDGSYQHYLNTDFAKGLNTLFQGEWNFGLGHKTGIDLPGESSGSFYIEDANKKYAQVPYDLQKSEASMQKTGQYVNYGTPAVLAEAGIGQSQQFTTMELGEYAMTLADDGKQLKPHLLSKVYDANDTPGATPIKAVQPTVVGQVKAKPQDFQLVKQAMHEVTTGSDSTAYGLFNTAHYQVAAKTGTAQISEHHKSVDNSVFICYGPLNNPQVALAVMIPGGGYGASLAGVIARQMMDAYFNEHHASFMPKSGWTNTKIPANWGASQANTLP